MPNVNTFNSVINDIVTVAKGNTLWVAYSGGVDSHVLLHLLATSAIEHSFSINAIHIDHGLQANSSQWAQHCADVAADLAVPFKCVKVSVENIDSLGMEAAARAARYQAIESALRAGDIVLTAQHQHDQAETVLLQLLRGAGPKGLSAMSYSSHLGEVQLVRPFLNLSQADIVDYAHKHQLNWIDDPSNVETKWSRNYLRHTIWPNIEQRWPAAAKTLSRSAHHCAETSQLLSELAEVDLMALGCDQTSDSLPINKLLSLSSARMNNVLRHFIELKQLAMPSTVGLQQMIDDVCSSKPDSNPVLKWPGVEVRRFQNHLYISKPLLRHDASACFSGNATKVIPMSRQRSLCWQAQQGQGLKQDVVNAAWRLGFRQGGERIKLQGHDHHKSLKHLFQQWSVPPWLRDTIPLIFSGDELIAVVGYGLAEGYAVADGEMGYLPIIEITDFD